MGASCCCNKSNYVVKKKRIRTTSLIEVRAAKKYENVEVDPKENSEINIKIQVKKDENLDPIEKSKINRTQNNEAQVDNDEIYEIQIGEVLENDTIEIQSFDKSELEETNAKENRPRMNYSYFDLKINERIESQMTTALFPNVPYRNLISNHYALGVLFLKCNDVNLYAMRRKGTYTKTEEIWANTSYSDVINAHLLLKYKLIATINKDGILSIQDWTDKNQLKLEILPNRYVKLQYSLISPLYENNNFDFKYIILSYNSSFAISSLTVIDESMEREAFSQFNVMDYEPFFRNMKTTTPPSIRYSLYVCDDIKTSSKITSLSCDKNYVGCGHENGDVSIFSICFGRKSIMALLYCLLKKQSSNSGIFNLPNELISIIDQFNPKNKDNWRLHYRIKVDKVPISNLDISFNTSQNRNPYMITYSSKSKEIKYCEIDFYHCRHVAAKYMDNIVGMKASPKVFAFCDRENMYFGLPNSLKLPNHRVISLYSICLPTLSVNIDTRYIWAVVSNNKITQNVIKGDSETSHYVFRYDINSILDVLKDKARRKKILENL